MIFVTKSYITKTSITGSIGITPKTAHRHHNTTSRMILSSKGRINLVSKDGYSSEIIANI